MGFEDQICQGCNQEVNDAQTLLSEDYLNAHIPDSFQSSCHLQQLQAQLQQGTSLGMQTSTATTPTHQDIGISH